MQLARAVSATTLVVLVLTTDIAAQSTTRVSVDSSGIQGDWDSSHPVFSADERSVAFLSTASNLVPNDTNGRLDVFVRDVASGAVTRVSVDSNGGQSAGDNGSGASGTAAISGDGRYVVFSSIAADLVPGDGNGLRDVFVHDRQTGQTVRVSVSTGGAEGNWHSGAVDISANGRFVSFASSSSNLVAGDTNGSSDVFVHDRQSGTTSRVSVNTAGIEGNDASGTASLSVDGRWVAFWSEADNLVRGDANGADDIFLHDNLTGSTTLVSLASDGAQVNEDCYWPRISGDGRFVAFVSEADNLVPGDTNSQMDAFVRDLRDGVTRRVSVDSNGVQAERRTEYAAISYDGRFVAFSTAAWYLVPEDTNHLTDVFVHDLVLGVTTRESVGPNGSQANNHALYPAISSDGRYVAFDSHATTLVPGDSNGSRDAFVHDRGAAYAYHSLCSGDGSKIDCPCGNNGAPGRGCQNSAGTGGAILTVSGAASVSADTLQFHSSGELRHALSILFQGDRADDPAPFGDGLRCTGGRIERLFVAIASEPHFVAITGDGTFTAPRVGDPTVSARSAAKGDVLALGSTRCYQVYYRDPLEGFCPSPAGGRFNASGAVAIAWGP